MSCVERSFSVLFFVLATAALSSWALDPHSTVNKPPNIILITLDTTRADRMGFLGSTRGLTPNLDALAKQSIVFTRAYAQVPLTTPSHAAMLTGTYPQFSNLRDLGQPLRANLPYLPDVLHQHGYHTAAFLGAMILDPASGAAPGFDRGFDVYDSSFHNPAPGEDRYQSLERRAEDVANRAMPWLQANHEGPFFLWLHFYDPHHPYDPPEPFKSKYASNPYDGEIAYTDSVVGGLLEVLERHGMFDNTLITVAADHGEAFGEHGEMQHGLLLYDETIHVPFLLKFPGEKFAGKQVDISVALASLAPSLLEMSGIAIPTSMQARSLIPLVEDSKDIAASTRPAEKGIYSESDYAHHSFGWSELRSWRTGRYMYVQAPEKELYEQSSDPDLAKNLAKTSKAIASTLDAQLSEFLQRTSTEQSAAASLSASQIASLNSLGYMASDNASVGRNAKPGVNPKDKVKVTNQIQDAIFDVEEGRYKAAMTKIHDVVQDPDAVNAYLEFGIAMARQQQFQEAIALLRTAARKQPESVVAHFELAKALANSGDWAGSLPEMQAASVLRPDAAQFHFFIASVYGHLNRVPDAISEYEKALKIDPSSYETNLTYGRLLLMQGKADAALPKLLRAAQTDPASAQAHSFLADAYEKLGQAENAKRERTKAATLKSETPE